MAPTSRWQRPASSASSSGTPLADALPAAFYDRDPRVVAPELLNKVLVKGPTAGRIVEVEAYVGAEDPACHSYRGPTARNATMFGPPGRLYVYFIYGMHWCLNAVCGPAGTADAVLVRAVAPIAGVELMRANRPGARRDVDLTNGPAKLCQAFAITGADDGADLVDGDMRIVDDGVRPPAAPGVGPRIGLAVAAELPWRWVVPDDPHVSRGGGPRRRRPGGG